MITANLGLPGCDNTVCWCLSFLLDSSSVMNVGSPKINIWIMQTLFHSTSWTAGHKASPTSCSVCLCRGGFRSPHHTFCVLNIEPGLASKLISMSQISHLMSTEQRAQKQLSPLKLWTNVIHCWSENNDSVLTGGGLQLWLLCDRPEGPFATSINHFVSSLISPFISCVCR